MNIFKHRSHTPHRPQPKSGQSRSFEERRRRRIILGGILGIAGFAAWAFIFYKASSAPALALTDVRVSGVEADFAPSLRAAAYRALQGTYLGVFSKANTFLYPRSAIVAAVGAVSPRIQDVEVRRDGLHGIAISISEKMPVAVACVGLPNFDDAGAILHEASRDREECYFTDDAGLIFKHASSTNPAAFNRYYVPLISDEPIGRYATSTETFLKLQGFIRGAKAGGIVPEAALIKSDGEYELYVQNPRKGTAVIYFNETASLAEELSNLSAFWNSINGPSRSKSAQLDFEYIDVRYGSNVFYRLIQ